jgi:hypothetical protein
MTAELGLFPLEFFRILVMSRQAFFNNIVET